MEERGSPVHLETVHHCASARLVVACPVNYYLLPVPHKYFTLDQANRTLPLVRRIVADITALYPAWRDLVYRYELASAQARPEQGESPEQLAVRAEIDGVALRINSYLQELEQIGCVFKGFEAGAGEFYGKPDGRGNFLGWKQGGGRHRHWHELWSGLGGRQPPPAV